MNQKLERYDIVPFRSRVNRSGTISYRFSDLVWCLRVTPSWSLTQLQKRVGSQKLSHRLVSSTVSKSSNTTIETISEFCRKVIFLMTTEREPKVLRFKPIFSVSIIIITFLHIFMTFCACPFWHSFHLVFDMPLIFSPTQTTLHHTTTERLPPCQSSKLP